MNSSIKNFSDLPPSHCIKYSPDYIPISGHYVNGFIAAPKGRDGSLYLRTKI